MRSRGSDHPRRRWDYRRHRFHPGERGGIRHAVDKLENDGLGRRGSARGCEPGEDV